MSSVNKAILIGNVGRAPERKDTAGGTMAAFSIATEERVKEEKKTTWHNIICFGKTADAVLQYVGVGQQVYVEGRIDTSKYQAKDGTERWSTKIIANSVQFLGKKDSPHTSDSPDQTGNVSLPSAAAVPPQPNLDDEDVPF